ncbi:hypothetical protein D3C84_842360 [compost metagenome]
MDAGMYIQPLDGNAPLPRVTECSPKQRFDDGLPVGVSKNNCCVVAAQLKRDAFEITCTAGHHLLARCGTASEADLSDSRMFSDDLTKLISPGYHAQHSWWQDRLSDFTKEQRGQRRVR